MKYIMCAKRFPVSHPKAGQPTGFREAILSGRKIHTLRQSAGNRKTGDTVSLREWEGRPYASKQVEFAHCEIKVVNRFIAGHPSHTFIADVAHHDGFADPVDFVHWFTGGKDEPMRFDGVCIYFRNVREVREGEES